MEPLSFAALWLQGFRRLGFRVRVAGEGRRLAEDVSSAAAAFAAVIGADVALAAALLSGVASACRLRDIDFSVTDAP